MTLAELRTQFLFKMNRTDPDIVEHVDAFINAAVRYCERKWMGAEPLFQKWTSTYPIPAGVGTTPLPACWRPSAELRVFVLPDRTPLMRIHPRNLREPFYVNGDVVDLRKTDTPDTLLYYTVLGRAIELRPLPKAPTELEIVGTGFADPLTLPADESVVTQECPDGVLYAACREAWLTLGDEPQMTYWQTQADMAIAAWVGDRVHSEMLSPLVMEIPGG